jgi:sugar phosphate isomerase/epimerase
MSISNRYSRRDIIRNVISAGAFAYTTSLWDLFSSGNIKRYRIGACDWSIGKRNDVGSIELAKKIGLDGVQVSLGSRENNMHLRRKDIQEAYWEAVRKYGVKVSSLAIGELNKVPYKSEIETEQWVADSINVAKAMDCSVILLAFFDKGDLRGDEAGISEVIRRLKKIAPNAEKAGVLLGIESWLSADKHLDIIQSINSKNVKVYYDVANSFQMGYDIYEEIRRLGREYICEIHAKENGYLLGEGKIDFVKIKSILDQIKYNGWVIIESAVPKNADIFESYVSNNRYLRSVLNG